MTVGVKDQITPESLTLNSRSQYNLCFVFAPMNSTTISKSNPPHPSTFFPNLKQCHTIPHLKQLHAQMIKTALICDPLAAPELLRLSSLSSPPLRDLTYARLIFLRMDNPNCFSYNTIIRALADSSERSDDPLESILLFYDMMCSDFVRPNKFTFPSVFKACGVTGRLMEGRQVHGQVIKQGLECDEFILTNLVRMYVMCGVMSDAYVLFESVAVKGEGLSNVVLWNVMMDGHLRTGDFESARRLFDKMPQRSIVSWNSIISGYAQNGYFREAVNVFRDMQMENASPNYVTLVSVLPAISRLGALELGKWVHLYAEKNGIRFDVALGSALIDMYSKCGNIEKAISVFEGLSMRNVVTWNAIIGGLAMHGRAKEALEFFMRMEKEGVTPSDVTFISVLSACSHSGLVNEGRSIFENMVKNVGLEPRIEHYGCMVDLLGRAGLLQEAEKLIFDMPFKPDDVILKSLLGACKLHRNIDIGERIAKHLMEMVPNDSGSYVALSNLYASLEDWEQVVGVRTRMKEMDVRKDPGCSFIELDGVIHEFFVEDDTHHKAKEIDLMLKEMSRQMGLLGYRPNTSQVLLNIDDEEKESALFSHSEKIAVAFGLISTVPQTPLRVVKNLRICDDCHSSMKLISNIYSRTIIVRDRKRFHHFENGLCSCNDYW